MYFIYYGTDNKASTIFLVLSFVDTWELQITNFEQ